MIDSQSHFFKRNIIVINLKLSSLLHRQQVKKRTSHIFISQEDNDITKFKSLTLLGLWMDISKQIHIINTFESVATKGQ